MSSHGLFFQDWFPDEDDLLEDVEGYDAQNAVRGHLSCHHLMTQTGGAGGSTAHNAKPVRAGSPEERVMNCTSEELMVDFNISSGSKVLSDDSHHTTNQHGGDISGMGEENEAIHLLAPIKLSSVHPPLNPLGPLLTVPVVINYEISDERFYLPWIKGGKRRGPTLMESYEYLQSEYSVACNMLHDISPKIRAPKSRMFVKADRRQQKSLFVPPFLSCNTRKNISRNGEHRKELNDWLLTK